MLVKAIVPTEQVVDVICDVCGDSTTKTMAQEYGTLSAHWGYGSVRHDGERYEVHLCEDCFFETLASLRQSHLKCERGVSIHQDGVDGISSAGMG